MHAIPIPWVAAVLCAGLCCAPPLAAGEPSPGGDPPRPGGSFAEIGAPLVEIIPQSGDKAAYATWNAHAESWVYGVELRDADTGRLLSAASRTPPWTAKSMGWRGFGAAYLPSNGIRIPRRVGISWWFDREAARQRDPATRQGPYVIDLRARIGERALAAAQRGERRYMLEIGVAAGVVPPLLRWHLLDRRTDPPGGVVERGGDEVHWRPTSWR